MKTLKLNKLHPKYWKLARKNKQFQYQTEYKRVLQECDGDVDVTELIMFLKKQEPEFEKEPPVPGKRPELKLIKCLDLYLN